MKDTHEEYTLDFQKVLLSYALSDNTALALSQTILKPEYFHSNLKKAVKFILDYTDTHNTVPMIEQINAVAGMIDLNKTSEVSQQHREWYLTTVEKFCRYKALEKVIVDSLDLLDEGRGAEIEQRVKDAQSIALIRDLGTDYYADPKQRLTRNLETNSFISSGWQLLDSHLRFEPASLYIFAAGSGVGKSIFLQNISLNWSKAGLNVVYFSIELSEKMISERMDAMLSGYGTKAIYLNIDEVATSVRMAGMKHKGSLFIKRMPENATTTNVMRAFLKEYEIQTGKTPDAIVVDYLDIVSPNSSKVDSNNIFLRDSQVSLELRAMAHEYGVPVVTASQLNRGATEETEYNASHLAGGIAKQSHADALAMIFAPSSFKEKGKFEIQFIKVRTENSTGKKITLRYNPITMLLSDPDNINELLKKKPVEEIKEELKTKLKNPETKTEAKRADIQGLMSRIKNRN